LYSGKIHAIEVNDLYNLHYKARVTFFKSIQAEGVCAGNVPAKATNAKKPKRFSMGTLLF
jgi:hypothetical protein